MQKFYIFFCRRKSLRDKDFYSRLVSRKPVNMYAGNLNFDSDFRNVIYDPSILRLEGRRMVE